MQQQLPSKEVFDYITQILISSEFKLAIAEFYEKNCHHFEDREENKHIYKQIHEEYQVILDNALEAKLVEKFPDLDLGKFFEEFQENYKNYENQETVDTLFSFTEFEKFKAMMLEYSQKSTKVQEKKENTEIFEKEDNKIFFKYYEKKLEEWDKVLQPKSQYELSVYCTPFENSGYNIMRIQRKMKDVSLKTAAYILGKQDEEMMSGNKRCKEVKNIAISENEYISYIRVAPPVISEREILQKVTRNYISDSKVIISMVPVEHKDFPIGSSPVRANQVKFFTVTQDGQDIFLDGLAFTDLKGYIPKMFMNMMVSKLVTQAMKNQYERMVAHEKQNKK